MNALPRQCAEPRCPGKTLQGSYCRRHRRDWVGGQPSSAYPGWTQIRARVLAEEPTCGLCGAPSTEVDHIVALAFGGTHDRLNLRGICHRCHIGKTAEDSRLGKARKQAGTSFSRYALREYTSSATRSAAVPNRNVGGR
jgi:5-methylcytosine-specific restriction protein A